ncbi:hypothetical protein ARMSODRAFT_981023 [Armillaria solidipes]|uniref:Protein kinase domain-containing protein n=1 Tax=Armillaria solidipes TaxID=1076256 RepID=A0A2H3ATJ3_9AGAR|nr:hypothetical protein ARMSODRAFT_981023 [Armillaria solidipes]
MYVGGIYQESMPFKRVMILLPLVRNGNTDYARNITLLVNKGNTTRDDNQAAEQRRGPERRPTGNPPELFFWSTSKGRLWLSYKTNIRANMNTYPRSHTTSSSRLQKALRGISVIAERKVIHCDIEPGNIMVTSTVPKQVAYIDFGCAVLHTHQDIIDSHNNRYCSAALLTGCCGQHRKDFELWAKDLRGDLAYLILEVFTNAR